MWRSAAARSAVGSSCVNLLAYIQKKAQCLLYFESKVTVSGSMKLI